MLSSSLATILFLCAGFVHLAKVWTKYCRCCKEHPLGSILRSESRHTASDVVGGGGRSACYVTPDLSYERERELEKK